MIPWNILKRPTIKFRDLESLMGQHRSIRFSVGYENGLDEMYWGTLFRSDDMNHPSLDMPKGQKFFLCFHPAYRDPQGRRVIPYEIEFTGALSKRSKKSKAWAEPGEEKHEPCASVPEQESMDF